MTTAQATRPARPGNAPAPRGRTTPARDPVPWRQSVALAAALTLCAASLNGILEAWTWLPAITVTVCSALSATLAARALRLPAWLVTPAGLLGLMFALTAQFLSSSALLWVLPTTRTGRALEDLLDAARDTVVSEVAPVIANPGITLVVCFGVGVIAVLTDAVVIGLRMPAVGGLGLAGVLLAPALIKPQSLGAWGFAAAAAGFLMVLGTATAEEQPRTRTGSRAGMLTGARAVGVAAVGLMVALVLPTAIPGFSRGLFPEGSRLYSLGQATGLNPIVTLGQDLRSQGRFGRMTYATSSTEAVYLRSVTLEDLTGRRWAPDQRRGARIENLSRIRPSEELFFPEQSEFSYTRVNTASFTSPWLLAPYAPVGVSGLNGNWSWDPRNLSILADDGATTAGQSYTVRSVSPSPDRGDLGRIRPARPEAVDPIFLQIPDDLPGVIRETSRSLTGGFANPYDKAMAIQNYLRGIDFIYSERAPVEGGYDGSGVDVVARFLERRSGYCVHFASTMAILARLADIPSRVAVGYAPGRPTGQSFTGPDGAELAEFEIDSRDAHAWPELYFEGIGWVRFEPTPSRGVVPSYAQNTLSDAAGSTSQDNLAPGASAAPAAPESAAPVIESPTAEETSDGGAAGGQERANGWPLALLVGVAAALPRALRSLRSWRRRERIRRGGPGAATLAWRESTELAKDFGFGPGPAETPRRFAERLHAEASMDEAGQGALARLRAAYEREQYAPPVAAPEAVRPEAVRPEAGDLWRDVATVQRSLWAAGRAGQRLRSVLLPASLTRS